ncbi:HAD-IC family P-type ATPase [Croceiramulus getboli]|nr:HAD-IC family P-type ATPase [Flavobacteriaceae bacterium YJPT1-3]
MGNHLHVHSGTTTDYRELVLAGLSGLFLLLGYLLQTYDDDLSLGALACYLLAYAAGGFFATQSTWSQLCKGRFEIDFLMILAALGAAFLNKWAEGALLLFLFSLGHALEHYALSKAHKSIAALTALTPKTAMRKVDGRTEEVALEDLNLDDIILVRPHAQIAADGVILAGAGSVDQSSITGESIPVDKLPLPNAAQGPIDLEQVPAQHRVFAGTLNGNAVLEVRVLKKSADSTVSRLVQMVQEAQQQKSPTQRLADNFQRYYVPAVLLLVVLLLFAFTVVEESFRESFYRAMAVLVAASPCALAISTPSAVLSGIASGARRGVLFKGGRPLEDLGMLQTIAFDKTGTLTQGTPQLTDAIPFQDLSREELFAAGE